MMAMGITLQIGGIVGKRYSNIKAKSVPARCKTDVSEGDYNYHHYRPISEGGTHELHNLVVLCLPCHKLIHPTVDNFGIGRKRLFSPHRMLIRELRLFESQRLRQNRSRTFLSWIYYN